MAIVNVLALTDLHAGPSSILAALCGGDLGPRLLPIGSPEPATNNKDWGAEMLGRLARGDLSWELQLQFFVDEATTPIEDASVEWTSPFVTVARLTMTKPAEGEDLTASTESAKFDPWNALAEHRPLGDVMRARKAVYFVSQKGRGVA